MPALTIPSFSFAFPCSTAKVVLRCHGHIFICFVVVVVVIVHVRGPCLRCHVASVVRSLEDVACKSKKKQKPCIRSTRSRAPYVMKETRLRLWQHGKENAVSLTPNDEPPTSHSNACKKKKKISTFLQSNDSTSVGQGVDSLSEGKRKIHHFSLWHGPCHSACHSKLKAHIPVAQRSVLNFFFSVLQSYSRGRNSNERLQEQLSGGTQLWND